MPAIRAICFDLDGTLYDLPRQKKRLWKWMIRHPRVLLEWQKQTESMRGERHEDIHQKIAQSVADQLGLDLKKAEEIINKVIFKAYPETFRPTDLLSGLEGIFFRLDALKIPRAIVSDHPSQAKLAALNQSTGWACIVDCSSLGALKPLPDGLAIAAQSMNIPVEAVILIGDRQDSDGEMALNAGAQSLIRGIDWQHGEDLADTLFSRLEQA
jgi:phosphoglycolate phosphatase/putative hydrolase of the HAD superfamily